MKIFAIVGSPRGEGAGHTIVRKIESLMKSMGPVEFENLFLKDANLKLCRGCYTCIAHGEASCPLNDDRAKIDQKILAADGVILSTPVYVNSVSWLMKNFMDRFSYGFHRPRFHRQKVLTVVNAGGGGFRETAAVLKNALGGSRIVSELGVETPPWPQTENAVARKERAIEDAAQKFFRSCLDKSLPSPTFSQYLNFLVLQKVYTECRKYLPADYPFFHGKTYYYETDIHPLKAAFAKAVVRVLVHALRDLGPGHIPWPLEKRLKK